MYSNDSALDIKDTFKIEYEEEKSIEEIEEKIKKMFASMLEDEDEAPNFWCILADLEWRYGVLTEETKNKALEVIKNGGDVEFWKETSSEKEAEKRKNVLVKLEKKLKTPQPPKKKIVKREPYICKWERGDVFAYKMDQKYMEGTEYYNKYLILIMWDKNKDINGNIIPIVYIVDKIYKDIPSIENIKNENIMKFYKKDNDKYKYKIEITFDLVRERKKLEDKERIGKIENLVSPKDEYFDKIHEICNTKLTSYDWLSNLVMCIKFNKNYLIEYIEKNKAKKRNN